MLNVIIELYRELSWRGNSFGVMRGICAREKTRNTELVNMFSYLFSTLYNFYNFYSFCILLLCIITHANRELKVLTDTIFTSFVMPDVSGGRTVNRV